MLKHVVLENLLVHFFIRKLVAQVEEFRGDHPPCLHTPVHHDLLSNTKPDLFDECNSDLYLHRRLEEEVLADVLEPTSLAAFAWLVPLVAED